MNNLDSNRIRILEGNLFERVTDRYDFILSNPPYINPELKDRIEESVLEHEPAQALFGGKEGMVFIHKILSKIGNYLNKDGILYIEHEPEQTRALSSYPGYLNTCKDQYSIERFSRFIAS